MIGLVFTLISVFLSVLFLLSKQYFHPLLSGLKIGKLDRAGNIPDKATNLSPENPGAAHVNIVFSKVYKVALLFVVWPYFLLFTLTVLIVK